MESGESGLRGHRAEAVNQQIETVGEGSARSCGARTRVPSVTFP